MNASIKTHCVPSSFLCALIYAIKERRPVRIAISAIEPGVDHAQAQVQDVIDDKWFYLSERWNGECMEAYTSDQPNMPGAVPYRYAGLIEFLYEQGNALDIMNLL